MSEGDIRMDQLGLPAESTWSQLLLAGEQRLIKAGIGEAKLDSWYLFSHTFSMDRARYYMNQNQLFSGSMEQLSLFWQRIEQRVDRKPLQYILGSQEFMGLEFLVNQHVLIPRQDTETLVEQVLMENQDKSLHILDVCTGSGCIGISLKKLGGYARVCGLDISPEALSVARENGSLICGDDPTLQFFCSDLFDQVEERFDVIVSNPPYIPTEVIANLEPEVKQFEPMLALHGMEDGLFFYRKLICQAPDYLNPGGRIYLEIGWDQAEAVTALMREFGFTEIEVIKDGPGLDRVVKGVLRNREVFDV